MRRAIAAGLAVLFALAGIAVAASPDPSGSIEHSLTAVVYGEAAINGNVTWRGNASSLLFGLDGMEGRTKVLDFASSRLRIVNVPLTSVGYETAAGSKEFSMEEPLETERDWRDRGPLSIRDPIVGNFVWLASEKGISLDANVSSLRLAVDDGTAFAGDRKVPVPLVEMAGADPFALVLQSDFIGANLGNVSVADWDVAVLWGFTVRVGGGAEIPLGMRVNQSSSVGRPGDAFWKTTYDRRFLVLDGELVWDGLDGVPGRLEISADRVSVSADGMVSLRNVDELSVSGSPDVSSRAALAEVSGDTDSAFGRTSSAFEYRSTGELRSLTVDAKPVPMGEGGGEWDSQAAAAGFGVLAFLGLLWALAPRFASLIGLFARTTPEELVEHTRRASILKLVKQRPGANVGEIARFLGVYWTVADYHVRRLAAAGLVRVWRTMRRTAVFPAAEPPDDPAATELSNRKHADRVLSTVRKRPGVIQKELLEELGLSRKVFRDLEPALLRAGLLERRSKGRAVRYYLPGAR